MTDIEQMDSERARKLVGEGKVAEGISIYERLIDEDTVYKRDAAYVLGTIYEAPIGVQKDLPKAKDYYEIASSRGHQRAALRLAGVLYSLGDFESALEKFKQVADVNPSASYWIYRILSEHKVSERDDSAALTYLRDAASRGHIYAKKEIAVRRIKGKEGVLNIPWGIAELIKVTGQYVKENEKSSHGQDVGQS